MSETAEPYRAASKQESNRWSGFHRTLRKEGREPSEEMMNMCRSLFSRNINLTDRITFQLMVISILLAQQKKLQELRYELNEVLWSEICIQTQPEPKSKP